MMFHCFKVFSMVFWPILDVLWCLLRLSPTHLGKAHPMLWVLLAKGGGYLRRGRLFAVDV